MMRRKTIEKFKNRLKDRRIVVVGMARTGVAAAEFLLKMGALVTVTDVKPEEQLGPSPQLLRSLGADVQCGGHSSEAFLNGDLIILSPGVDPALPFLEAARANGIPIMSEIELAFWYLHPPLIAVTGTNGKSTTTALIGHILSHGQKKVFVGGNIGTPLTNYLLQDTEVDYIVAEISSFQLETISDFRPWIAVLLNLEEDHLERHSTFSSYAQVKSKIFSNQKRDDWAVVNNDDPIVRKLAAQIHARILPFGRKSNGIQGIWLEDHTVRIARGTEGPRVSLQGVKIIGRHNVENIMAAIAVGTICGVPPQAIQQSLNSFLGLEHRLEFVKEWRGVSIYNDSKATNVSSTLGALMSFSRPIVLLAGGKDKGGDYTPLRTAVEKNVNTLILMGEAKEKMSASLHDVVSTYLVQNMEEGVRLALDIARRGDVILLSPACASFDMFNDYAERGSVFKQLILTATGGTA